MTAKKKDRKKKENGKGPGGRPTKYRPEYCKMLVDHMAQGLSFESFAASVDCTRSTLYEWREHNHEFSDAFYAGEVKRLAADEVLLQKILNGKMLNSNARLLEFKMRCCHSWRDKIEVLNKNVEMSYEDYINNLDKEGT